MLNLDLAALEPELLEEEEKEESLAEPPVSEASAAELLDAEDATLAASFFSWNTWRTCCRLASLNMLLVYSEV